MGLNFDALDMHGVYYSVKVVFFFCNLEKILEFLCFFVFCAFVGVVWVGLKTTA